jgi:hypothetical protein
MTLIIAIILWLWVPLTLWMFWTRPPAVAVLISMIGGWLLLPTAPFVPSTRTVDFPYWIMPACLPSLWTTKARIIGLACLLGVAAFDFRRLRSFRIVGADYFMAGWCLIPLISALANRLYVSEAIANTAYQTLAWGVPYVLGRRYFTTPAGINLLAQGMLIGGLVYAPLCLLEWVTGPFLYGACYGFHPFQTQGAERYVGYRPMVFLEDGNQLGTWLATVALIAVWLWRAGRLPGFWKLPAGAVVAILGAAALLAQSVGAVILLVIALACLEVVFRLDLVWSLAAALCVVLGLVGLRVANVVDTKGAALSTSVGRAAINTLIMLDRTSFGWRLRREEQHTRTALQRPLFGWGRCDWWRDGPQRPWGLFALVFGIYGVVGLVLLLGCFTWPLVHFMKLGPPHFWATPSRAAATALAAALTLNVLDAILNGAFLLPMMAAAGGLVGLGASKETATPRPDSSGNVRYKIHR